MNKTLIRICELQPKYSSTNTPEMQERGVLIRTVLAGELRSKLPALQSAFDGLFDDLAVEGSDGMGRKTEAPWVRLYSKAMSPTAREGFYLVIHFAANGLGVFITVGCGSTVWKGGDLQPVSDVELVSRTSWARSVVEQKWKTLAPFVDQISLGAVASLPRTFEKATAFAKRLPADALPSLSLDDLLFSAAQRLSEIYLAQLDQRDVSLGEQTVEEIQAIAHPLRRTRYKQGRGLTVEERKAVELCAMREAFVHLAARGFECTDTSATESYDILAVKGEKTVKVEVKGTTSDFCDSILMTKNELDLHRAEKGHTCLVIVSSIRLSRDKEAPSALGGNVEIMLEWDVDLWQAEPIAFQVSRQTKSPSTSSIKSTLVSQVA